MDQLLQAIITGLFGILAALITAYRSDLIFMLHRRKRNIKGKWIGQASEKLLDDSSRELTYSAAFEFHQFGSRVTGNIHSTGNNGEHYQAQVKGQMEDEHFVTLVARSSSPQDFNFGVVLLELDAKGKHLNGYALGNGLSAHGIALAKMSLSKDPN